MDKCHLSCGFETSCKKMSPGHNPATDTWGLVVLECRRLSWRRAGEKGVKLLIWRGSSLDVVWILAVITFLSTELLRNKIYFRTCLVLSELSVMEVEGGDALQETNPVLLVLVGTVWQTCWLLWEWSNLQWKYLSSFKTEVFVWIYKKKRHVIHQIPWFHIGFIFGEKRFSHKSLNH